ncbi:MAG TPA: chaperone modulator CbpM [Burkholderiales bacterium]|nr:chaperone modulator CbpM [Burkholderiales bacterium]
MSDILDLLSHDTRLHFEELLNLSGLHQDEVHELIELGFLQTHEENDVRFFSTQSLVQARRAARLRRDFDLNISGMVLALSYLERIDVLERRIKELECHLLG